MNKFLSQVFLMFLPVTLFSQINVGSKSWHVTRKAGEFKSDEIQLLKNAEKTVFVYKDSDIEYLEELKAMLSSAWTITDLEFVHYSDIYTRDHEYEEGIAYWTPKLHTKVLYREDQREMRTEVGRYYYYFLYLAIVHQGEWKPIARIELFPEFDFYLRAMELKEKPNVVKKFFLGDQFNRGKEGVKNTKMMQYLLSEGTTYNWNPLYLKNAFQFIQKQFDKEEEHWMFEEREEEELAALQTDTLYVPAYAKTLYNGFKEKSAEERQRLMDEAFEKYPYAYKVVEMDEIMRLAEVRSEPVYYLSYLKCNQDKHLSIMEAKSGSWLYYEYRGGKKFPWIKSKDISKLSKAIKKAK